MRWREFMTGLAGVVTAGNARNRTALVRARTDATLVDHEVIKALRGLA
jgi:hypothetical protein